MYKIRTIDVWDTLLRRDCHPECIKLATARYLLLGWAEQLKPEFRECWSLYRARLQAEVSLAELAKLTGQDDEYEITKVLTHFVGVVFSGVVPDALPKELAEFELKKEIERSFVDPGILEFLIPYKAEKTLFLSDFYMSGDMLQRILSSKGLDALVYEGLSSCDVGLNKRSGKIFGYLHTLYSVSPNDHMHIGDNEWSDILSPSALGVNALHYLPEKQHAERLEREKIFSSRDLLFDHLSDECTRHAQDLVRGLSCKQSETLRLGIETAPLFIGFLLWVAEQSILHKLNKVYFITEEGEFLFKIFRAIFPEGILAGHNLPATYIFPVSRNILLAEANATISAKELSRLCCELGARDISGLFQILGINIKDYLDLLNASGLNETNLINEQENILTLCQLLEIPALMYAIKKSIANHAINLKEHFERCGLVKGERIAVVSLRLDEEMLNSLAIALTDVHIYGLELCMSRDENNGTALFNKDKHDPVKNANKWVSKYFLDPAMINLLCQTPYEHLVSFAKSGILQQSSCNSRQVECGNCDGHTERFQMGVVHAAKEWQSYIDRYVITSGEVHTTALRGSSMPTKPMAGKAVNITLSCLRIKAFFDKLISSVRDRG